MLEKTNNRQSWDTGIIGNKTQNEDKSKEKRNAMQSTKKMSNNDPHQVLTKGKQFLFLIRHSPCYFWLSIQ